MVCQEDPKWDLNEEVIIDLKEIFLMFDTDQVSNYGSRISKHCQSFVGRMES